MHSYCNYRAKCMQFRLWFKNCYKMASFLVATKFKLFNNSLRKKIRNLQDTCIYHMLYPVSHVIQPLHIFLLHMCNTTFLSVFIGLVFVYWPIAFCYFAEMTLQRQMTSRNVNNIRDLSLCLRKYLFNLLI